MTLHQYKRNQFILSVYYLYSNNIIELILHVFILIIMIMLRIYNTKFANISHKEFSLVLFHFSYLSWLNIMRE